MSDQPKTANFGSVQMVVKTELDENKIVIYTPSSLLSRSNDTVPLRTFITLKNDSFHSPFWSFLDKTHARVKDAPLQGTRNSFFLTKHCRKPGCE